MNILTFLLAALLAPLLPGIVNQTKAFFAGRRGPGLFRLYFDLAKLVRKSCPRSATSTWLFDLAPSVSLAATVLAAMLFPWGPGHGAFASASAALFFYLLGTGRFFTVLGALDTGSAFEGMGASREVQFSALVEPIVFIILGFLVCLSGDVNLQGMLGDYDGAAWTHHAFSLILIAVAFFTILLCENCRVPFDDPETHLELTMIHEAMILDNAVWATWCGPCKGELPELGEMAKEFDIPDDTSVSVIARMRFLKTPQVLLGTLMVATLGAVLYILF